MIFRKKFPVFFAILTCYGFFLGISAHAENREKIETIPEDPRIALDSIKQPAPGSEGDTFTVVDKRMAYLVYKLLDKNGKIKGANLKRGKKLFYQNCRGCHGLDGRRINFTPTENKPTYLGNRAREDMPTFWYQMNFGGATRENMEAYYDEIELDEMVDIAGYAQTLP